MAICYMHNQLHTLNSTFTNKISSKDVKNSYLKYIFFILFAVSSWPACSRWVSSWLRNWHTRNRKARPPGCWMPPPSFSALHSPPSTRYSSTTTVTSGRTSPCRACWSSAPFWQRAFAPISGGRLRNKAKNKPLTPNLPKTKRKLNLGAENTHHFHSNVQTPLDTIKRY